MIGLALGVLAYVAVGFVHARFGFRHEYAKLKGQRVPAVYGHGWMSPKEKRARAIREALWWVPFWYPFDSWIIFGWLVSGSRLLVDRIVAGPDPEASGLDYAKIEKLESDLGLTEETSAETPGLVPGTSPEYRQWASGLTARELTDNLIKLGEKIRSERQPCPCGYLTECHIHCGDGTSCHGAMDRTQDATERRAVRNVFHPETGARPDPWLWDEEPEFILTPREVKEAEEWRKALRLEEARRKLERDMDEVKARPGPFVPLDVKVPCSQCRASVVAMDFYRQGRMMDFKLGDRLVKPCTCGRKMIERYWEMRFGS